MPEPSRAPIALWLLGQIRVRRSGGEDDVTLAKQRKRLALAAYLALQTAPVRRESVTALLWPELDETGSRRALRQALHFLRDALGEEAIVSTEARELAVDSSRLWCDAVELRAAHEAGEMERVVELYGGELLEGFHVDDVDTDFEYWLDGERRRVRDRAVEAHREVIRIRREAGRHDEAIELARRALEVSPTDEVSLRALLRLLDDRGDRLEALEVYASFADRIRERLSAEPSVETRGVVEAIRERHEPVERDEEAEAALPELATPTLGRDEEIAMCLRALARGETLLTLSGPGGVGKSRVAIEVAAAWREESDRRAVFVRLSSSKPEDVRDAIAERLGVTPRREPWKEIERELSRRTGLLVVDGLEVSEGAVERVAALASPRVRVLVTSVAPLRVVVEREIPVPPLSLPATDRPIESELPLDSEAVALFVERARAVEPGFELARDNVGAVVEVCRRLDGIPLAIELAAAQIRVLPVHDLARRLAEDLDVLRQDVRERPERQRTMEAAIRWTLAELGGSNRRLLLGLSVLRGEFGLATAERLAEAVFDEPIDVVGCLAVLVDRGLVKRPRSVEGEPRYALLGTVRTFARPELEASGEAVRWHRALAERYETWVIDGRCHYCRPSERQWLRRLRRERDNLDGALAWAIENDPERAARIAAAVWYAWYQGGTGRGGVEVVERILTREDELSVEVRAELYGAAGALYDGIGDPASAVEAFRECHALHLRLGNVGRAGWAVRSLGVALQEMGELERAREAIEGALEMSRTSGDVDQRVTCLLILGTLDVLAGHADDAEERYREAMLGARRQGNEAIMAQCQMGLGDVARLRGASNESIRLYERALRKNRELGRRLDVASASLRIGHAARSSGVAERAWEAYARAVAIYREAGYLPGLCSALVGVAGLMLDAGDAERAAEAIAGIHAWAEVESIREPGFRQSLEEVVALLRERLDPARFEEIWRRGETLSFEELVALVDEGAPPIELRPHRRVG